MVAAGLAPIDLALAPGLVMCRLGMCMMDMNKSKTTAAPMLDLAMQNGDGTIRQDDAMPSNAVASIAQPQPRNVARNQLRSFGPELKETKHEYPTRPDCARFRAGQHSWHEQIPRMARLLLAGFRSLRRATYPQLLHHDPMKATRWITFGRILP